MIGEHFYHKSIKKVIATFGSLFSEVKLKVSNDKIINVPIHFSQKEKYIEAMINNTDVANMYTDIGLPVMGFEIVNYLYNPEKMTNPINIQHQHIKTTDMDFQFTSIPYSLGIELYVMTNTLDEGYQILEQIVPFFAPNLTVTIFDNDLYNLKTNITFDLTAVSQDVQYESTFDDRRIIMFNYSFNAHTKFHSNPRNLEKVKKIILNMRESDHEDAFMKLIGNRDSNGDFEFNEEL